MGKVSRQFSALPSTNEYATNWLLSERPGEGAVVIADHQSAGRGQMGSTWEVQPGQNLTLSVILYPRFLTAHHQFDLNQAVALAVQETIADYTEMPVKIKWPNDILVGKRKICGILIQNTLSGKNIQSSIAGIGINVNQKEFPADLPNAGSLYGLTGRTFDLEELRSTLFSRLETRYIQLKQHRTKEIKSAYLEHLFQIEETQSYAYPSGETFRGMIKGIDPSGKLIVETEMGRELFGIKDLQYIF